MLVFGNNAGKQGTSTTTAGPSSANLFGGNAGGGTGTGTAPANLFTGWTSGQSSTNQGQNMFQQSTGQSSQGSGPFPVYQPLFQQGSEMVMMGLSQQIMDSKKMIGLMAEKIFHDSKQEKARVFEEESTFAKTPYHHQIDSFES